VYVQLHTRMCNPLIVCESVCTLLSCHMYLLLYFQILVITFMCNNWEKYVCYMVKYVKLYVGKPLGPHKLLITTVENYY
jgi:hypothetical protein